MDIVTLSAGLKKTNNGSVVEIMNYIFLKTSEFMSANLVIFNKILKYIYTSGKMQLLEHKNANMFKAKKPDRKARYQIPQTGALITSADNGRSFIANSGTKAAVLLKGRSSTANLGTRAAVLLVTDRCCIFPLLSEPQALFSI